MTSKNAAATPSTWRVEDGSEVPLPEASVLWAAAAREILTRTAKSYHAYLTYGELAAEVQEQSGVRTRSQTRTWIPRVLGQVADDSHDRGEPALTALCVRQDESIGDMFGYVATLDGGEVPKDLDRFAADARMLCYSYFGAELPSGGGHAALTPKVAAARKRAARDRVVPTVVCPTCFTQLPSSGQCDNCG